MRKYDKRNKINFTIIIGVSLLIIVMFYFVISFFLHSDKKEYEVFENTLLFDKDKTVIKVDSKSSVKAKWNKDYYLKYNKKNYNLGNPAIGFNKDKLEVLLYGKFYEISSSDEIKVIDGNTKVSTSLTKFYKLDDRKYLLIDRDINSLDKLLSTTGFLIVDLDRAGNATLVNDKVSLKTFAETTIVTSNYSFDIANEILTFGTDKIDLKKIIGSSNEYEKEDLIPDENEQGNNDGVTDVVPNNGSGNGTGNGGSESSNGGEGSTIIEEIKKASKKTSIVSVKPYVDKIDIDYVIYDPYKEYIDVYMEVMSENSNDVTTIHLNSGDTSYSIGKDIFPNTKYNIKFKTVYIDPDKKEEVRETIDDINVITKLPNISIKATSTSFGKIGYQISFPSSYDNCTGILTVVVNGADVGCWDVKINGNTIGEVVLENYNYDDIIELKLDNIKVNNRLISGLKANYIFKY